MANFMKCQYSGTVEPLQCFPVSEGVWTQGPEHVADSRQQQQQQLLGKSFLGRKASTCSGCHRCQQWDRGGPQDVSETERTGETSHEGRERRHQYVADALS